MHTLLALLSHEISMIPRKQQKAELIDQDDLEFSDILEGTKWQ